MKNFLFISIGIIFSFILLECLVRLLPPKITKIDYNLIGEERIFTSSRQIKFIPNLNRVWTGLGRPTIWSFNDLGYRERGIQLDKPSNIYRIVFLGDSIIMGFGVEEYESLPRQLEDILRPQKLTSGMAHIQVLNLGIQGFSSPQYLAEMREDVVRMNPDLAIIGLYYNDPMEAVSFEYNKKYSFLKSLPDLIPYSFNRWLRVHSKAFLLVLNRYYNLVEKYSVAIKSSDELIRLGWNLTSSDIAQIKEIADKSKINLLLVGIPHPSLEVAAKYPFKGRLSETTEIAKKNGIQYYDLLEDLRKYRPIKNLYLDDLNDHFSIEGNRYAAGLIANYLIKNSLVPKWPQK